MSEKVEVNFRLRKLLSGGYEWKCAEIEQEVTRDDVAQWIDDLRHAPGEVHLGDVIIDGNAPAQRKRIAEYLELVIEEGE